MTTTTSASTRPSAQTHTQTLFRHLLTGLNAVLPPLLWAGIIFLFSAQKVLPSVEVSTLDYLMKKGAHMFIYAVLYALLVRASAVLAPRENFRSSAKKFWLLPFTFCLLYALTDEAHQAITGGTRTPTARDIIYDMLGAGVVFLKQYRYI